MDREIGVDVKRSVNEKQRYKMIKNRFLGNSICFCKLRSCSSEKMHCPERLH